jgi:N-acetylmuramoyl-L-alanine amidase
VPVAHLAAAAALVCLDPGHGTPAGVGIQREPIGPGSSILKIKDGGGAVGEAEIVLRVARKTRELLLKRGYRVAMTRTGPTFTYGTGGNVARAKFCNERHAALMLRIHADGSTSPAANGIKTLYPVYRRGWTDDIYVRSLRAARAVQRNIVAATGARDLGLFPRSDLTGFNWADVPSILVETGFTSNPGERRKLESDAYEWRVARGLIAGVARFVRP